VETTGATSPDAEIEVYRKALQAALDDILGGLHRAGVALGTLVGSKVYDLDFAETLVAEDMRRFLEEAARMVRAVQALNPAREELF
jgi:hypothetical protein